MFAKKRCTSFLNHACPVPVQMKILYLVILFLAVVPCLMAFHAYGMPPIEPQVEYFNSDTVLIGKILAAEPYSPTQMKYNVQVEQYLKNPQAQDIITVIADGTNKTLVEQGVAPDTVYDVGQNALLYLKNENGNYLAWYFSHSVDSLCDPAPTKDDLNFSLSHDAKFSTLPAYSPLRVESGIPYLFRVDDTLLIHYDTWNRHFTTKTFDVEFDIKNETNGELLSNVTKQVELKPCIGHKTVDTSFIPKKAGTYEIDVIFYGSLLGTTIEVEHNVISMKLEKDILSPLQQFREGIAANDVTCFSGFQLILKAEDGSPACVTPDTAKNLFDRQWAMLTGSNKIVLTSFMPCDNVYPQSDAGVAVLYMPTDSIGKICIRYYNVNNTPTSIGMRIFEADNLTQNASDVTAWTSDHTLEGNANKTIVYFIKTGNKTGFYGASLNCGGIPLAVGYGGNSTITASDFPWVGRVFHCGVITYDSKIEGTSGIGVKYIPYP